MATKDKSIFIKNVYYMLAYAFRALKMDEYDELACEDFEHMHDLFAAILAKGIARQHGPAMSVLSASLRKEFVLGPVHLDHRALLQLSSEPEVVPLPILALNLRYYLQFVVQRDELRRNVMVMQIGSTPTVPGSTSS